jgi:ribose 5-phosphate isomerase RpiB
MSSDGKVLHWNGQVLSALELRGSLNGQRELILSERAVITPSAAEELRARGVRITRRPSTQTTAARPAVWGYAQDRPYPHVQSLVQTLEREGIALRDLGNSATGDTPRWARELAACIARSDCCGGLAFCQDAELACCVANKMPGLRAAAVATAAQGERAASTLGVNLLVVEMPGRTFFEIRQIVRSLCRAGAPACPAPVAGFLQELDGHAHR